MTLAAQRAIAHKRNIDGRARTRDVRGISNVGILSSRRWRKHAVGLIIRQQAVGVLTRMRDSG